MAYVLVVEQFERQLLADRTGLVARGVTDEDLPTMRAAQAKLDDLLAAEPQPVQSVDSEQYRLRQALGVA